jgi:hypothetical protein
MNDYIIITDPGCVPDLKGPFNAPGHLKRFLKEAMAARPFSHLMVASCHGTLMVSDGTQELEMLDMRSSPTARKHRARLKSILNTAPLSPSDQPPPTVQRGTEA